MDKITGQNIRGLYKKPHSDLFIMDSKKVITQKIIRELPKLPIFSSPALITKIKSFTSSDGNYYLGFGGLGDAILLLAACYNDPKARVIFFANNQSLIKRFFELFGIQLFIHDNIMGTQMAGHIYEIVTKHKNFKTSAHLADGLFHGDWFNEQKYIQRIPPYAPWIDYLGITNYEEPVLILAPSGSNKDLNRQRYLNNNEYNQLVNKHIDLGYRVFSLGSMSDLHFFGLTKHARAHWLTSDLIYNFDGTIKQINLTEMLRIINGASKVISVDTWLKSYTLLCNIPTIVIQTRWNGNYLEYGKDDTDWIFLNPKIWKFIKLEKIENLLL